MQKKIAIIGGGAAGFFAAIQIAENNRQLEIHIFEKGNSFLSKVKISGGGRCNVTHACFDPEQLVKNYPRGNKEMLGPFYAFNPVHTVEWFAKKNISIIAEDDGRMFPSSNSSQTIIDCFIDSAHQNNIQLHLQSGVQSLQKIENGQWELIFLNSKKLLFHDVLIASGSSHHMWTCIGNLGHSIEPPVASLFTFNCKDERIADLMGVSVSNTICSIPEFNYVQSGPLLITHWGFSGPGILKLSSWAAKELFNLGYSFTLSINFIPLYTYHQCYNALVIMKQQNARKRVCLTQSFGLAARLFKTICTHSNISEHLNWADLSKEKMQQLAKGLTEAKFKIKGKSNFKDEFVTCGGVQLHEIDFKTMQSKLHANLYFAGEVLNIDAVTGGFNFQAAWTMGAIAAKKISATNI